MFGALEIGLIFSLVALGVFISFRLLRFPDLTVSHMQKSKFSYIENECGIKIIGTFETFSPTFPTPEIASILRISPRDPILKIQTQAVDSNSIPLDYSLLYSNIFEFQVKYFFPR
jgi:GntR family glv operon transcriptional regulator